MTHNANKRRTHNAAARAAKQHVAAGAGERVKALRRSPYGRRLADLRTSRTGSREEEE